MIRRFSAILLVACISQAAGVQGFELSFPVDCALDRSCYIQQYVDHDISAGASDFTCSGLSYDGHKGTDFALITLRQMEDGVNVLSAAQGRVAGLRDGMKDQILSSKNRSNIQGKDCGNRVVITHENAWTTQYCNMKQDSIRVQIGQRVAAGEILGQIGLSGRTEFPIFISRCVKIERSSILFTPKTASIAPHQIRQHFGNIPWTTGPVDYCLQVLATRLQTMQQ